MLKRFLNITVCCIVLITGWLIWESRKLNFDYDFEHFFPVESDDAAFYFDFRDKFESDNEFLLLGIESKKTIFDSIFLSKIDQLNTQLKSISNVKSVYSLIALKSPIINSFGFTEIPIIRSNQPQNYKYDSLQIFKNKLIVGNFVSQDAKHLAIYVWHKEHLSKSTADSLLIHVNKTIGKFNFKSARISGKIKSEQVYLEKTQKELFIFMSFSIILVTIFLWFTFRNAWGVFVPLSVVLLSIIWTIGIMAVTGKSIDIMVILIPCILFVVGMSDVIHITSQFYEKIDEGLSKYQAISASLKEVGFATFLTCVSTAFAFLTLNTTSIQPIRDFGTYTAIGVTIAYMLSITILPWILIRVKDPNRFKIHTVNKRWDNFLRRLLIWVFKNPKTIIVSSFGIFALALWGISLIKINNSMLDDLDEQNQIKKDFSYFDKQFSGIRGLELAVWCDANTTLFNYNAIKELEKVEDYLINEYQTGGLVSPVSLVKGLNQAFHNGDNAYFIIPKSEIELNDLIYKARPYLKNKQVRAVINKQFNYARFSGRIKDKGSFAVSIKNKAYEKFIQNSNFKYIHTRITGSSDLIDKSNQYLTQNMLEGLSLDIAVMMIIIGFIFKSWRMMLISVIPNIIPLCLIAGIMGWAGIEMKVTISIIFSIAFGIAVDDTLHLISRLKIELNKGTSLPFALRITFLSTGKAMILTAMVISAGFSTLMLSDFKSTFYVGMLISLTLVIALIAELILMPVIILWIFGKHYKKHIDKQFITISK
jgi:predicted RND superfamily exporter protein